MAEMVEKAHSTDDAEDEAGSAPPAPDPQLDERYTRVAREGRTTVNGIKEIVGNVSKEELLGAMSRFFGVAAMIYTDEHPIPFSLLEPFTPAYLKHHRAVPVGEEAGKVVVLMENPRDIVTRDDLVLRLAGRPLDVRVGIREDVFAFIDYFYGRQSHVHPADAPAEDLDSIVKSLDDESAAPAEAAEEAEAHESEAGIVRLVSQIITQAHARGASDIHLEPYPESDMMVRFRVDGICKEYTRLPRRFARAIASRIKIMSGLDIAERRLPQDGKIRFRLNGRHLELRVATMPTQGGLEDVVMRLLAASKPRPVHRIDMREENLQTFKRLVASPYGILLCVGPTGSGKTTTLHSAVGYLNTPDRKIWTAEDPVEITQYGIRQVQIHHKIGLTFERALRGFLRSDPDIIMIGEMRDRETANAAVEASLTGHLVFSTLHTNNAPETVTRLLDMGVDPFAFGDSLLGVLAQRLVRKLCNQCLRREPVTDEERLEMEQAFEPGAGWERLGVADPAALTLPRAKGCPSCNGSGYRGRMGVHELMPVDDALRRLIFSRAAAGELRAAAVRAGMWTLRQDALWKVMRDHTDLREVRRVVMV